ncbi:MAG TPA: hypothetical protein VK892_18290 [Pyrinomonadaceae bacterium]|nr:hypothetical protein [Pyrinomonadaceae bacterium]
MSLILLLVSSTVAQKSNKKIFAVVNDGKQIEPIAFVKNGKLTGIGDDVVRAENNPEFAKTHYKPRTKYNLIFGGADAGTVTVVKDLSDSDCAGNQAQISIQSRQVNPKGFVMALATDAQAKKSVKGVRRLPLITERAKIEELLMAEMKSKNVPIKNTNEFRYHNLTKLDVDNDGDFEFVGSYWYNTGDKKRSLLFFIADKDAKGEMSLSFKKFEEFAEENVLSKDINDLDKGLYHELLLDVFDYDGDGVGEVFTITQAFEGSNFNVYKRANGKWTRVLETSNYHCAY